MSLPQPFLSNLSSKGSTKKNGRNCLKNGCAKLVLYHTQTDVVVNWRYIISTELNGVFRLSCAVNYLRLVVIVKWNTWICDLIFLSYHFYFQELPANSVLLIYLSATGVFPTGHSDYEGMFFFFCFVFFVCNFMEFLNTIIDRFGVEISNVITAVSTCLW